MPFSTLNNPSLMQAVKKYSKIYPDARLIRNNDNVEARIAAKRRTDLEETGFVVVEVDERLFWIPEEPNARLHFLRIYEEIFVLHTYVHPQAQMNEHDVVIDCGANVGTFSKYAIERGASKVIAVEPDKRNYACLLLNLAKEIREGRVFPVCGAVGAANEEALLAFGDHFATHKVVSLADDVGNTKSIPIWTIDSLLNEAGLPEANYIKMDIEGYERFALQGARRLLTRASPRLALCAYHEEDCEEVLTETLKSFNVFTRYCKELVYFSEIEAVRPKVLFFRISGGSNG